MYCITWFHTTGLLIASRKRSMTVGDMSRLSDTLRHWNWNRPDPCSLIEALLALTRW